MYNSRASFHGEFVYVLTPGPRPGESLHETMGHSPLHLLVSEIASIIVVERSEDVVGIGPINESNLLVRKLRAVDRERLHADTP